MAAVNDYTTNDTARHATVHVDYVRTATAAGLPLDETLFFPQPNSSETEALEDLEERIRRITVHHLNDMGIPVSARRPFSVEATPEIPFVISAARLAFKYLPIIYKKSTGWWMTHQQEVISSHYQTAAISVNLNQTFDPLKRTAIASLPLLEQKVQKCFPGIKIHIWMTWTYPSSSTTGTVSEGTNEYYSLAVSAGCIRPGTIIRLIKKLDTDRGGNLHQSLVAVKGRRWMSMFVNRVWVLPQNHPWAKQRMHVRR